MAKSSVAEFFRQVRQETVKVTWATRRETLVTTAMVMVMVIAVALFFFAVDEVLSVGVRVVLGLGG